MKIFRAIITFAVLLLVSLPVFAQQNNVATPTLEFIYPNQMPASPMMDELLGPATNTELNIEDFFPPQVATATAKGVPLEATRIDISIAEQRLRIVDNFQIRYEFLISSGNPANKGSIETPRGVYTIQNYAPVARKQTVDKKGNIHYGVALVNWMAVARNGGVGIRALNPKEMGNYESLLGKKASHGCIRLSRKDSKTVSDWAREFKKTGGVYPQVYIY